MSVRLPPPIRLLERGWLSSNSVLLTGPDDTALIDSGYATHAGQTLALVRHALAGRSLDRLLNTHLHSDHCGGNAALRAAYGCQVAIPALDAARVAAWDEEALSYRATGQQCPRFGFDATLAPGMALMLGGLRWEVLAAPGHDPHALLFFCAEEGVLVSGDALWEDGFGVIFPELAGEPGFDEVGATLDLIAGLGARVVIPGHGSAFTGVDGALARARARLDYLRADPVRNARNAVKVLLKFLLLERQAIALAALPQLLGSIPLVERVRRAQLGLAPEDMAHWAAQALLKAGAARIDGAMLHDV
ncbi:MBL fold metallo-hydrolase [Massilia niastensis]|uniref:MBL fold metallo-hydrolase n=1 Tax=Massilia niastensis TaxID=544911 RepID=UPI00037A63D3|nr:MBL fold metallo-hydrolase [Massilia niastensis]